MNTKNSSWCLRTATIGTEKTGLITARRSSFRLRSELWRTGRSQRVPRAGLFAGMIEGISKGAWHLAKGGHPLGQVSTGKKVSVPKFCLSSGRLVPPGVRFFRSYSNPSFRLVDSGAVSLEAVRSVTHLVLALGTGSLFLLLKSFPVRGLSCEPPPRPTRNRGSRKHSVPVRVHSIYKELWFAGCGAQPVCDSRHGRIAVKKSSTPSPLRCGGERGRLQSNQRARRPTPFPG
jgi:hypothetical protein